MFRFFMNLIKWIVTIFVALFTIASICLGLGSDISHNISIIDRVAYFVIAIVCGLIMYVIIYYWFGNESKCPSCKKRFCIKKTGKEVVNKEQISVLAETKTRNVYGEVIGTQEQYIPGERVTYRVNKVCKKCGRKCYSTYTRDIAKI